MAHNKESQNKNNPYNFNNTVLKKIETTRSKAKKCLFRNRDLLDPNNELFITSFAYDLQPDAQDLLYDSQIDDQKVIKQMVDFDTNCNLDELRKLIRETKQEMKKCNTVLSSLKAPIANLQQSEVNCIIGNGRNLDKLNSELAELSDEDPLFTDTRIGNVYLPPITTKKKS